MKYTTTVLIYGSSTFFTGSTKDASTKSPNLFQTQFSPTTTKKLKFPFKIRWNNKEIKRKCHEMIEHWSWTVTDLFIDWGLSLLKKNFDYDCVRSYEDDVEQSGIWIFSVSVACLQNHSQACFEVALSH